jgi:Uncharacterized proteins, homologs of lactam utilization protein B
MLSVDLNCDMGESFGAWKMGNDAELMEYVSSVNIACGFHAGDPGSMRRTVETAVKKGVAIGAHPGYPDLQGFGRRDMSISPNDIGDIVLYQVAALKGICEAADTRLNHVKPHGALYNRAAKNAEVAAAIADAVKHSIRLLFYMDFREVSRSQRLKISVSEPRPKFSPTAHIRLMERLYRELSRMR